MVKVLIIDDEEPVRRAVKKLGKWKELGVETIYESNNGERGFASLIEHQPDIVFVDMKMPIMNGSEFLEKASREKSNTEYIVISGYSDYEFTRQALKVKVLDYLLKPISGEELNRALDNAVGRLAMKRNEANKDLEKSIVSNMMLPLLREKVYNELIFNGGYSLLLKDYEKRLNLRSTETYFGAAVLWILNFEQICSKRFRGDSFAFYFSMINILNEVGSEYFVSFSMKNVLVSHQIVMVFEDPIHHGPVHDKRLTVSILKKCCEMLQNVFGVQAVASAGAFHIGLRLLHESFTEATRMLNKDDLPGDSKALPDNNTTITYNVKKYIDENYSEEIKLIDFSERFYVSKEHLCRIFKNEFGCGIYEYTLKVRMEKAREMLKNKDIQIQSVAELIGYSDRNYFSRAFKKYFGYSPTDIKTMDSME